MSRSHISYRLLFALSVLCLIFSCNKDLPLPDIKSDKKIVLLGELIAGDTFLFRAGQSMPVTKSAQQQFELVRNITMTIRDTAGAFYVMKGQEDSWSTLLYTIPFSLDRIVASGNTYIITATHPSLGTATANVHIPGPITAIVDDTASRVYNSENTLAVKVVIKDPANVSNYYVIEAVRQIMDITGYYFYNNTWNAIADDTAFYHQLKAAGNVVTRFDTFYHEDYSRQSLYTADPYSENVANDGMLTKTRRVLLEDSRFNGQDHETTVYIVKDSLISEDQRGRIIVHIKSVSEDYFNFLKEYEIYVPTISYSSTAQPVKVHGNVQNGYGMIGGVSEVKYIYINDTWDF